MTSSVIVPIRSWAKKIKGELAWTSLHLDVRDFDLERVGFSLSVLDGTKRLTSEGYLRMTLGEMNSFLKALKVANGNIQRSAVDQVTVQKRPTKA